MKCRLSLVLGAVALLAACAQRSGELAPVEVWGNQPAGSQAIAPPPPPRAAIPLSGSIRVASGETLYGISRRYGVPMRSLIEANRLAPPYRLEPGMFLTVPKGQQHIVQPGETLASVAQAGGVGASSLARANNLEPPYQVQAGQTLALPARTEAAAPPPPPPRPKAIAAAAPSPRIESDDLPPPEERSLPPTPPARMAAAPPPKPASPAAPVQMAAATPSSKPAPLPQSSSPSPAHAGPVEPAAAPIVPAPPPPPPGTRGFIWPVQGKIIESYGTSASGAHSDGINIAAPAGTSVLAAAAGTVAYVGNELRGYGNLVLIKHEGGYLTAYAHNGAILVHRGDQVARGQPIAKVGATGTVNQPQLHFEIRSGRNAVDPLPLLPQTTQVSSAND